MPKMVVVAGPPGGGKSTFLGLSYFLGQGIPYFNIDERCRQLHGSSHKIPPGVRKQANDELRGFCESRVQSQHGFAFETTLRQDFAIRMARFAREGGFETELLYIAAPVEVHVERVTARALSGGHAASEPRLREMYAASVANLPLAVAAFDGCTVYDSTQHPRLLLEARNGQVVLTKPPIAPWARIALKELLSR